MFNTDLIRPYNFLIIAGIVLVVNFLFSRAKNALDGRATGPGANS